MKDGIDKGDRSFYIVDTEGPLKGFPQTRVVAHMEWALKSNVPGVQDLLEYETRFNYVSAKHGDPVICTHDLSSFGAGLIVDILRTHPYVIIGGIVQENPFFIPPEDMLRQLLDEPRLSAFG
jgi:hypothetical protein